MQKDYFLSHRTILCKYFFSLNMSILKKIRTTPVFSNVFNFLTKGTSETQDAFDMYNLAVLFKCKDFHVDQGNQFQYPTKISNEKIADLELKLKSNNYFDDLEYVQQSATKQILHMFENIHLKQNQNIPLHKTLGYELEVRPSKIHKGGVGVFIKEQPNLSRDVPVICPGTVVSVFPGVVHLQEPLPYMKIDSKIVTKDEYIETKLLPDPHYMLLMRLDGIFIDSRKCTELLSHYHPWKLNNDIHSNEIAVTEPCVLNPYAVAQYVNHPPIEESRVLIKTNSNDNSGESMSVAVGATPPNVVQLRYDFEKPTEPSQMDASKHLRPELYQYIPNSYADNPVFPKLFNRNVLMHSSVLVSCQYLYPGDELTVDYRLGPDLPKSYIPEWYAHVDIDGARSRLEGSPRKDHTNIVTKDNDSGNGTNNSGENGSVDGSENSVETKVKTANTSKRSSSTSFKVVQR